MDFTELFTRIKPGELRIEPGDRSKRIDDEHIEQYWATRDRFKPELPFWAREDPQFQSDEVVQPLDLNPLDADRDDKVGPGEINWDSMTVYSGSTFVDWSAVPGGRDCLKNSGIHTPVQGFNDPNSEPWRQWHDELLKNKITVSDNGQPIEICVAPAWQPEPPLLEVRQEELHSPLDITPVSLRSPRARSASPNLEPTKMSPIDAETATTALQLEAMPVRSRKPRSRKRMSIPKADQVPRSRSVGDTPLCEVLRKRRSGPDPEECAQDSVRQGKRVRTI